MHLYTLNLDYRPRHHHVKRSVTIHICMYVSVDSQWSHTVELSTVIYLVNKL